MKPSFRFLFIAVLEGLTFGLKVYLFSHYVWLAIVYFCTYRTLWCVCMHTQTVHTHAVVNTVASIACTHQRRHRVYMLGIIMRLPMWLLYRVYVCGRPTWPPVCMILVWLSSPSTHGRRVWLHLYTVFVQDLTNTFRGPRVSPMRLHNTSNL